MLDFENCLRAASVARTSRERANHLAAGVDIYHGEFLPGIYDEWATKLQALMANLYFETVNRLIADLVEIGEHHAALYHAHRALTREPLWEEGQLHLMRLNVAKNEPEAARTS